MLINRSGLLRANLAGHALLAVLSATLAWHAGSRGFLPLDQSIVFDAGYRILSGQVPYADFFSPIGPVTFYVQAAAFLLGGVSYSTYIWTAAAMNVVGSVTTVLLLQHLSPRASVAPWVGGAVTAVWLTPPFGTPYPETTVLLIHLVAITLLVTKALEPTSTERVVTVTSLACGVLEALAFLTKQNGAVFMSPLFPLLALLGAATRRAGLRVLLGMALGAGTGLALFLAWVAWHGAAAEFWRYFYTIPRALGEIRLALPSRQMALQLFEPPHWTVALFGLSAMGGLLAGAWLHRGQLKEPWQAGVLVCYLYGYQNLFRLTVQNHWAVTLGLMGVLAGACCGAWEQVLRTLLGARMRMSWRRWMLATLVVAHVATGLVFLAERGLRIAHTREVHDIFETSTFTKRAHGATLAALRWPESVVLGAEEIRPRDVGNLLKYLETRPGRLFVFPDWTILYGLTGRPAPQPMLWFHRGVTYSYEYDRALDARIVRSLEQSDVSIVVLETDAMLASTRRRLRDFPLLRSYLRRRFRPVERFGIFSVLMRDDVAGVDPLGRSADALDGVR